MFVRLRYHDKHWMMYFNYRLRQSVSRSANLSLSKELNWMKWVGTRAVGELAAVCVKRKRETSCTKTNDCPDFRPQKGEHNRDLDEDTIKWLAVTKLPMYLHSMSTLVQRSNDRRRRRRVDTISGKLIIDVKFASGIKNINFGFYPYTDVFLALYTQYFLESCEKISQACYSGGIRTHDPCNSRAVSYQLDYRGCPAARGSSNPSGKLAFILQVC